MGPVIGSGQRPRSNYRRGAGSEIIAESDGSGKFTDEYIFGACPERSRRGGRRIAHNVVATNTLYYYAEDMLGSSRVIIQAGQTSPCYDGDFYPYGGERIITNTCAQNYKFEGKERDAETGNDDFGARYYSSRLGRWLSADWSAVPVAVPYANLTNPQTLNLYSMVRDNPETFADLDGHDGDGSGDSSDSGGGDSGGVGGSDDGGLSSYIGKSTNFLTDQGGGPASGTAGAGSATPDAAGAGTSATQKQNGDVATADRYLSGSKEMRAVLKAFKSGHFHLKIIHDGNDRYDPKTRTVYWDPNSALQTTDGGHQTPALGLGHEMAHATGNRHQTAVLSKTLDQRYDTKEERRVIRNYENPAAQELGESPRYDHGGTPYNVDCATCQ